MSKVPVAVAVAMLFMMSVPAVAQMTTKPLTPSQMVSPSILVARIDANCGVTRDYIKTATPVHVVLKSSTWAVASNADYLVADRTHAAAALVDVYRNAGHYVWIHAHRFTQSGAQKATQVCFRTDGTLARVREAASIPALDAAAARVAYFNTDGSLIKKTTVFEMNDPVIVKKIEAEPFYKVLP
ncbi:MAG: hypothetical protein JO359_14845 [Candidatus Eremiobacteraeota bacterium]|nr:hypothetical protein [Candidatus Eremiobacteraeota bacterium]